MNFRLLQCTVLLALAAAFPACLDSNTTGPSPTTPPPLTATATAPAATMPAAPDAISWDAAKSHVGQTATVTGPVVSVHVTKDGSHVSLNVGKDFPSPDRFTIFVATQPGAPDPETLYIGKTVTVKGEIVLFQRTPEIKADAKDVLIAK